MFLFYKFYKENRFKDNGFIQTKLSTILEFLNLLPDEQRHRIRLHNFHFSAELRQPAEERGADLDLNRGGAGGFIGRQDQGDFAEFVKDRLDQGFVEPEDHFFQLTAVHFKSLFGEL